MTCTHTKNTSHYVEETLDEMGTKIDAHWVYSTESTMKDIDLHRMRCTQCGATQYYSVIK